MGGAGCVTGDDRTRHACPVSRPAGVADSFQPHMDPCAVRGFCGPLHACQLICLHIFGGPNGPHAWYAVTKERKRPQNNRRHCLLPFCRLAETTISMRLKAAALHALPLLLTAVAAGGAAAACAPLMPPVESASHSGRGAAAADADAMQVIAPQRSSRLQTRTAAAVRRWLQAAQPADDATDGSSAAAPSAPASEAAAPGDEAAPGVKAAEASVGVVQAAPGDEAAPEVEAASESAGGTAQACLDLQVNFGFTCQVGAAFKACTQARRGWEMEGHVAMASCNLLISVLCSDCLGRSQWRCRPWRASHGLCPFLSVGGARWASTAWLHRTSLVAARGHPATLRWRRQCRHCKRAACLPTGARRGRGAGGTPSRMLRQGTRHA